MKKQKTVIMLEDIKENMLGEKHESLLDENKMLRELLKSALDENKKFCEDLELKQKEVDSYKKMNIEGKEEYGNLRKLYDGAKAERNEYFRMYSELLNENKDLKKSYENFVKAKNAQYLRKRKTSSQKDVDALNLKLEKARACISDLEAKNEFFYQESIHLKKRLDVYYSLHEGKNDVFDTVTGIVDELEKAFRVTFEFTEPSLKGMAELFRKEKAKMEYQYANIEYVDKMFDKIVKAQKSLKEKEEKFETNKKMVEELYPRFYYLIKNKKLVLEQISNLKRWEEEVIRKYVDECWGFVQEHREYLMYVPSYEEHIEPEMQDTFDNIIPQGKSVKIYVTQPEHTNYMVDIITEKDHVWKAIDNQISDEDISKLESKLNVILPLSYKIYLKYKHFYEIFWDLDVRLYPKPIHSWNKILIENNEELQEEILNKGYFAIGRYSDYGVIALKLTDDENKEGEILLFDYETPETEVLAPNFIEFLNQILQNPKPVLQELKGWEKKMYKME